MRCPRILIVFATTYGHTAKIAGRIRDLLSEAGGHDVTLADVGDLRPGVQPQSFDAVIVGGSVLFGRHQAALLRFVRSHRATLNSMPSAFFSVSGSGGSTLPSSREQARQVLDRFLKKTGWSPALTATFGGAIVYSRYNPLLRWVMKRIAARNGEPADASRDHELTDWPQVAQFVRDAAALARPRLTETPELSSDRDTTSVRS
jgi:menaquinone-dependent protoporphyrinogen oxidase